MTPFVDSQADFPYSGRMASTMSSSRTDDPATARGEGSRTAEPAVSRFDRKFIEEHGLIERYLENKLPYKGARELENWCRANPQFLDELKMTERTHASLKLLEASGRPQDLREPQTPWWKTTAFLIGLGTASAASLIAFWALFGKYELIKGELEDANGKLHHGSLIAPGEQTSLRIAPDRAPNLNGARVSIDRHSAKLMALRIDVGNIHATQFRVIVDKKDQGRALTIENLARDSNGDLRLAFNTSALADGIYDVRIESMPLFGAQVPAGWLTLDVH